MTSNRRKFLSWLAASPVFAAGTELKQDIITDPKQAINVLDFEPAAQKALPPAHWGYLTTGVEDDVNLRANRAAYSRYYLRPRRLIDVSGKANLQTQLFGRTYDWPVGLAPIGNMMFCHPQAEISVARAAAGSRTLQVLSTNTNTPIRKVNDALGCPAWFQLYATSRWTVAEELVRRAEEAGTEVILVTVDTQAGRRTETFERWKKLDDRQCASCHGTERGDFYRRKSMFRGIDVKDLTTTAPALTWKHIEQLRKLTKTKLFIKGIETHEDAKLCVETGLDGVVVSNHGGRAGDTNRGTLDCLPEIVDAVNRRLVVTLDGGIRRGSDAFKALALGARAVFIGRPYLWGLAAFGQPGVERVISLLRTELELVMKQTGVVSVADIKPSHIGRLQA